MTTFHGASTFRKDVLEKVGYYDNDFFVSLGADDLAIRILNAGYEIKFAKEIVINHYEQSILREKKLFFNARNRVWFNIKHFSLRFFPLLIVRDLIWIALLPYRRKSLKALLYGMTGYSVGYFQFMVPLKKRKVVTLEIQKKFLKHYLLSGSMILKEKALSLTNRTNGRR